MCDTPTPTKQEKDKELLQLLALYNSKVNNEEIADHADLKPLLDDMKENDEYAYTRFRKLLNFYYRNLLQRIDENRQYDLFENPDNLDDLL
jgi:hypothetical protein